MRHAPPLAALLLTITITPARAFNTNTVWWADDQLPIQVELVRPGAATLGEELTEEVVLASFDLWTTMPCTYASYEFRGWVDEITPGDGIVQIEFVNEGWVGPEEVAGATAIQVDPVEGRITDIDLSMNGEFIDWVVEDSSPYASPMALDVTSVLAHEFGHVWGLDHNDEMFEATMFWAYTSATAGTLSWDDKWGICTLYPTVADECEVDEDCPQHDLQPTVCRHVPEIGANVCEELYDELGACCDATWNNCQHGTCALHAFTYAGYCTDECTDDLDCPPTWTCEDVIFIGDETGFCTSPEGSDQPCGEDFVYPTGDDDDSAGDDDDSAADDDDDDTVGPQDDDDDDGCGCTTPHTGNRGPVALLLLLSLAMLRRR